MIWSFPRCHVLCNLPEGLPCCVFLKNILHSFGFFLNYSCLSGCDSVAKWQVSLFYFSVRSSESFIPLMSSNSNDVSLMVTLLTNDVKTCLSKYINGWQVPNNRFISLVFFRSLSIFPAKGFLVRNSFFSKSCCSMRAFRSKYWESSISPCA